MKYWKRKIPLDEYHRDKDGYMRGDRPFTKLQVHFVFTPKYRRPFTEYQGLPELIESKIKEVCQNRLWHIDSLAVESDHVHLLVQIPPNVNVSYVAQIIKGNVSKDALERYPEIVKRNGKRAFWTRKYSAFSVGGSDFDKTVRYIENQGVTG